MMGGLNMRRALLIARRDYLGYIKTWGFWVSFFLPFIFGILGFAASQMNISFEPTRYETIIDDTGLYEASLIEQHEKNYVRLVRAQIMPMAELMLAQSAVSDVEALLDKGDVDGVISYFNREVAGFGDKLKLPQRKTVFVPAPAGGLEAAKALIAAEGTVSYKGQAVPLNGALHIKAPTENKPVEVAAANEVNEAESAETDSGEPQPVLADYWSAQVTAFGVQSLAKNYFKDMGEETYLKSGNLTREGLTGSRENALNLESYDPTKSKGASGGSQKVTNKDRIPYGIAGVMAMLLWLTVFSGAYMLLTSMLEEKLNKLLEMMLATTNFGEIILGKLIGVGALTLTALAPYILLGGGSVLLFVLFGPAEISDPIRASFDWKMLVFFPTFLVLGYIFYGCLFIAMGALAESMQDAQTITTPIVMVLTLCILIVPLGFNSPDSPILIFASWFPLSAPFAAIARLPSDPPAWELFLSAGFLALLSVGVIMLASRVFRYGVLSGAGVKGISLWFKRTVLRRKNV